MERRTDREATSVFLPLEDQPGPATPLSHEQQRAVVLRAMRRVRRPRARPLWQLAAAAALALVAIGGAAAAVTTFVVSRGPSADEERPAAPSQERQPRQHPTSVPEVQARAEPAPAPAPAVVPLPARARTRDLLREANTLRARGNYARAERVYASIARSAAEPGEVEAATIAAAELRLEKLGDPHGALVLFRSALARRPESALSEEARFGLARCQRALGDGDAEASALRVFLADHPGSVLAPRARARLQALQTAAP